MSNFQFKVLVQNGVITEKTQLTRNGQPWKIETPRDLCRLVYRIWKGQTQSKNFQDWADDLNDSGDFEGTFTKKDAFDNLCSNSIVNVNGQAINLAAYFETHFPEPLA